MSGTFCRAGLRFQHTDRFGPALVQGKAVGDPLGHEDLPFVGDQQHVEAAGAEPQSADRRYFARHPLPADLDSGLCGGAAGRCGQNAGGAAAEIDADPLQIHRVVTNILENSLKYKDRETGTVLVRLERDGRGCRLTFLDDGPGVPAEALPHLFEVFYRSDPARQNPEQGKAVLICRCIPVVRSLISIPAGFAKMRLPRFLLLTTLGSAVWNTVLVCIGAALGSAWEQAMPYLDNYTQIAAVALVLLALAGAVFCLLRRRRQKRQAADGNPPEA